MRGLLDLRWRACGAPVVSATYHFYSVLALFVLAASLTGCGGAQGFTPVSGTVTLDGQPLEGASVSFQPTGAQTDALGSYGKTDAQGKFTLKRVSDDAPGAVAGDHVVRITKSAPTDPTNDAEPVKQQVPGKYSEDGVLFTVPEGGTDKADFAISKSDVGSAGGSTGSAAPY